MKLTARKDIDAPASHVFVALADFTSYEKIALRHGAEVQRTDELAEPGAGAAWTLRFPYRGRQRQVSSRVAVFDPPRRLCLDGESGGFDFTVTASLLPLSRSQTRLGIEFEFRARTFASRVLLQTLKLGKSRLQSRFDARIDDFAALLRRRVKAGGVT